jgi:UDP-N-acetylglucosamine/UDP-N-acetylgalactosamine diphosphorylase
VVSLQTLGGLCYTARPLGSGARSVPSQAASESAEIEMLRSRYAGHGQAHVFRFWDRLGQDERRELLDQAASIDLPGVLRALAGARGSEGPDLRKLEPPQVEPLPEHGGDAGRWSEACRRGETALRAGRVAAMVVAGGQATRLGYPGPKGLFPIGPVTQRPLFELQAQKLRGLARRYGRPVPWYVMTSEATDAATRDAFQRSQRFGLPEDGVFFLRQAMVPSFDFEDRIVLEHPGRIMTNPDGHGGSLTALLASGALDDMQRRGIDTLFYYQVDNPLVQICDPAYLGFHLGSGAEMSCKVIRKLEPMEKMGVLARADAETLVIEYTELTDECRHARDLRGELRFWAGNMALHVFSLPFLRRVAGSADRWLRFHVSEKKIPTVDDQGRPVAPREPNGRKLERFVFDALPAARAVCVVETSREREYAPVKNAEGSDSPATVRRALTARYRDWLVAAGIEPPPPDTRLEIDHSRVDGPEDLRALGIRTLAQAGDIIRTAAGAEV